MNTNNKSPRKVITGRDTRWAYAHVLEPHAFNASMGSAAEDFGDEDEEFLD